jgi:hypothetical protein
MHRRKKQLRAANKSGEKPGKKSRCVDYFRDYSLVSVSLF